MKKLLLFVALSASILMTSGCDFLRRAAGRPTSVEIEAKREYINEMELKRKALEEQQARALKYSEDSLVARDFLESAGYEFFPSSKFNRLDASVLESAYCLVIGSFSNENNALKLISQVVDTGFQASTIAIRPGFTAVGICCTDDVVEFADAIKKVEGMSFCPKDAWILVR